MFIYILNLLNDGLKKKNNIYEYSNIEIIKDAQYISNLGDIRRNFNSQKINDKIIEVFEVLNKYKLETKDSVHILNILIKNKRNIWILDYLYNENYKSKKESEMFLYSTIINMIEKRKNEKNVHKPIQLKGIKNAG